MSDVIVFGWRRFKLNCQSLPHELTLGTGVAGEVVLMQSFVPELAVLRSSVVEVPAAPAVADAGQRFEVYAVIQAPPTSSSSSSTLNGGNSSAFLDILIDPADNSSYTTISVNFAQELVIVDGTKQHNPSVRAGPLHHTPGQAVHVHAIVDQSIITVIFNNRTSLTVAVAPPSAQSGGLRLGSAVRDATVWRLQAANAANESGQQTGSPAPRRPWTKPTIHNSPSCV